MPSVSFSYVLQNTSGARKLVFVTAYALIALIFAAQVFTLLGPLVDYMINDQFSSVWGTTPYWVIQGSAWFVIYIPATVSLLDKKSIMGRLYPVPLKLFAFAYPLVMTAATLLSGLNLAEVLNFTPFFVLGGMFTGLLLAFLITWSAGPAFAKELAERWKANVETDTVVWHEEEIRNLIRQISKETSYSEAAAHQNDLVIMLCQAKRRQELLKAIQKSPDAQRPEVQNLTTRLENCFLYEVDRLDYVWDYYQEFGIAQPRPAS